MTTARRLLCRDQTFLTRYASTFPMMTKGARSNARRAPRHPDFFIPSPSTNCYLQNSAYNNRHAYRVPNIGQKTLFSVSTHMPTPHTNRLLVAHRLTLKHLKSRLTWHKRPQQQNAVGRTHLPGETPQHHGATENTEADTASPTEARRPR